MIDDKIVVKCFLKLFPTKDMLVSSSALFHLPPILLPSCNRQVANCTFRFSGYLITLKHFSITLIQLSTFVGSIVSVKVVAPEAFRYSIPNFLLESSCLALSLSTNYHWATLLNNWSSTSLSILGVIDCTSNSIIMGSLVVSWVPSACCLRALPRCNILSIMH